MSNTNIKSGMTGKYTTPALPKKIEKPVYGYKSKPSIIISEEFLKKVEYICSKVSTIEWSGVLLYKIEGTMDEVKNMIIHPIDILLMDIGSSAHTSFDYDPIVISEAYLQNPEWIDNEYRRGLIHSHVNMSVFFSGEDMSELQDNAKFYDFYLSLIVNNKSQMTAKIAFEGEVEKKSKIITKYTNSERILKTLENEETVNETVLFTADCEIQFPKTSSVSIESIDKRIEEIQKSKVKTSYSRNFPTKSAGFMANYGREIEDEYTDFFHNRQELIPQTPISQHSKKTSELMSKYIDAKSYLSSIFTEAKPTGTYKTFAKHIEEMAIDLITVKSKTEREGNKFYIARYLGNLFEDIFTGNEQLSYDVNMFKVYKEKINKKADWNTNTTRSEFIEFLVDIVDMLKEEVLTSTYYSGTQIEILESLIDYFEDFVVTDKRLDIIKLKTV